MFRNLKGKLSKNGENENLSQNNINLSTLQAKSLKYPKKRDMGSVFRVLAYKLLEKQNEKQKSEFIPEIKAEFSGEIPIRIEQIIQQMPQKEQKEEEKPKIEERKKNEIKKEVSLIGEEETSSPMKDILYMIKGLGESEKRDINMSYPLVPVNPKPNEPIFAWVHIYWDENAKSLIYHVYEPELTPEEEKKLEKIRKIIEDKIDVSLDIIGKDAALNYLKNMFSEIIDDYSIKLTPQQKMVFEYYLIRDFLGLGKVQPLMNDPNLEDISCDGVNIPVFVYHRNPKIGSLMTNIVFSTKDELDEFVIKLAQRCGRSVSVSEPLLEGALPDGSRVHAVLGTDIAKRGSNFTIRKFTKDPLTPIHLLEYGSINAKALAYLWFIIEHNGSILVSGPTAAGKTTLLNSLSLFIKPEAKIVSIEDTPELRLPHKHWVPEVARSAVSEGENKKFGEVTMFDLLKGSLRQRPDYIIVGEVRGKEAYILFQEMATGHAGMATMHADSLEKIIDRLTTPPINLPPTLLETLDVVIISKRLKYKGSYVRRTTDIYEIQRYDPDTKKLIYTEVFKWDPLTDKLKVVNPSTLLKKMAEIAGMTKEELSIELKNREKVLKWAEKNGIKDYRELGKLFAMYYSDPSKVLSMVESEI